ncbi:unnamed protein product [Orchesella dallaii]|uniref:Uncharacterized protein n=1 Tax=Orchesella dallaii TaxID=48710 RepID=A0ABP1QUK4_9HEXA
MEVYKTVIITGCSGSGKTAMRNATRYALDLGTSENENLSPIKEFVINASIFDPYELFGKINVSTGELKDGLITKILRASNESKHQDDLNLNSHIWIVFDGPMQKEWMEEGIHSIFDKDCAITLYNCDKVLVGPQVKLFFEVDDLSDASPRTIAKSGVIYLSEDIQQWKLTFKAWINKLPFVTIKAKVVQTSYKTREILSQSI